MTLQVHPGSLFCAPGSPPPPSAPCSPEPIVTEIPRLRLLPPDGSTSKARAFRNLERRSCDPFRCHRVSDQASADHRSGGIRPEKGNSNPPGGDRHSLVAPPFQNRPLGPFSVGGGVDFRMRVRQASGLQRPRFEGDGQAVGILLQGSQELTIPCQVGSKITRGDTPEPAHPPLPPLPEAPGLGVNGASLPLLHVLWRPPRQSLSSSR